MKQSATRWLVVSIAGTILLLGLALPAMPPAEAHAARIHAVNNLARPFPQRALVLSNVAVTNAIVPRSTP
jgi:hypothetical protein